MKYRLKSPYITLSFWALLIFIFVSWIYNSGIITIPFTGRGPDVEHTLAAYRKQVAFLTDDLMTWEFFIEPATRYFSFIFPVFSGVAVVAFYEEIHSSLIISLTRITDYRKKLLKLGVFYTLVGGLVTVLPFIILSTFAGPLLIPSLDGIGELSNIFPEGFYVSHPYIVFMFMYCVLYFPLAISYSIMSAALALAVRNRIFVCLIPFLIYFAENVTATILGGFMPLSTLNVVTSFNTVQPIKDMFIPIAVNYAVAAIILFICVRVRNKKEVLE